MESIIRDAMVQHLVDNDLCTTQQHCFTNGRSGLTHLLETFESWTEDVDKGYSVDVIFWIFKKLLIRCPKQDYCKSFRRMELKAKYYVG